MQMVDTHPSEIQELLGQIRQIEHEHNQLVDDYFKMKDTVKQASLKLKIDPSSMNLNIYNEHCSLAEQLMKEIRLKQSSLTMLIADLHTRGVSLDDSNGSENESSLDEGIAEHSSSSKLSSLENSTNQNVSFDE